MEQSTTEPTEKATLSSSSSAIPIPSAMAAASRSKRTKTAEADDDNVAENEEQSEDELDDKGEGLLFGDDDQMQSDEGSQVPKADGEDGKPRDEEAERQKLDQLMQKFGSPQDFNPMMHMSTHAELCLDSSVLFLTLELYRFRTVGFHPCYVE
jgi:hypothetical protein